MKRALLVILALAGIAFFGCGNALPEWTYPQIKQLDTGASYQTWGDLENSGWEPVELEARVTKLARDYEAAHPYESDHVCWEMSMELWQIFEENGIASFIATRKSEITDQAGKHEALSHVWLIVLYKDDLSLGIECITGIVYSPGYMQPYESNCEQAFLDYGPESQEWDMAKAAYDRAYQEYKQHLEGYFYRDPPGLLAVYPFLASSD